MKKEDDSELESPFSCMAVCNTITVVDEDVDTWIMDSGATDHMTATLCLLSNVKEMSSHQTIKLPTGDTSMISHIGDVLLSNGLKLNEVLYVPKFNHNLLSIHKLAHDNKCQVVFFILRGA